MLATDDDDRSKGNGPSFVFRMDPNAADIIRASFKVEHDPSTFLRLLSSLVWDCFPSLFLFLMLVPLVSRSLFFSLILVSLALLAFLSLPFSYAGLRIRIRVRIGSGFNRVSGSGSRRAKMTHKCRKFV